MKAAFFLTVFIAVTVAVSYAQPAWQANLDSKIRFYQTTDFGLVLAGTERSLYAFDGPTGERLWRLETGRIGETAVTPVPGTDVVLLSRDLGSKSLLEAADIMTGAIIWQSEKIKGDVLQLAVDPENDLVALVLVKDPRGASGSEFKRTPTVYVLQMSSGQELWKRQLDSDIDMMPSRFGDGLGEIAFTLDNYRAPLMLDGRLFLFYEGSTSYDARTGNEKEREKFKINEGGLALTEADPVVNGAHIFTSGRGKVRAINRRTGKVDWKADDLGTVSEMALVGGTLFVRTGGRFTRLKDGETESKGPFGISAIDASSGETKWRYKGADKGITNFVFADANSILVADRDEVHFINAATGKRIMQFAHKVDRAEFVMLNESGAVVVGGRDEIAAFKSEPPALAGGREVDGSKFKVLSSRLKVGDRLSYNIEPGTLNFELLSAAPPVYAGGSDLREIWRVRHKAPGRGALRIIAGIALRATAIYFRYGGVASSAFGIARGGLTLASAVNSFRWSGLSTRFGSFDLTTLASNAAKNYAFGKFYSYGAIARTPGILNRISGFQIQRPNVQILGRIASSRSQIRESVIDRLDPVRQAERLSSYLLRKKRLSELQGNHMYFFTELPRQFGSNGMVGVNVHTGRDSRYILVAEPDAQFVTDDTVNLLYSADGSRLQAFHMLQR